MTSRSVPPRLDPMFRGIRVAALGAFLTLLPSVARAEDPLELAWDAPPSCPRRAAVLQRVRELAGPVLENAERLRAAGRITRVAGRYELTLTVFDKHESRVRKMTSHSCVDLAGAAAVALGLLIRQGPTVSPQEPSDSGASGTLRPPVDDGTRSGTTERNTGKQTPADTSRATTQQPATSAASGRDPEDDTTDDASDDGGDPGSTYGSDRAIPGSLNAELILRAPLVFMDVGPLPLPGFGIGGAVGIHSSGWRVTAGGRILTTRTWLMERPADVGADVGRWQAELWLCKGWRAGRAEFSPCLAGGLDGLRATGTGPGVTPSSQKSLSIVAGVAGTAHVHVFESMALVASLGLLVETTRPVLAVEGLGRVGQVGPLQLSAGLGSEWIF